MSLLQAWSDAPDGAVTDHEIVMPVFKQATEEAELMPFAKMVKVAGGDTFTVVSISDIDEPTDASLSELETIPLDKLTVTSLAVSVNEEGRGIEIPRRALNRYRDVLDLVSQHRDYLARQQALRMDTVIANALDDMPIKYVATAVASQSITTTGTASGSALVNPNMYHLRKIRNYLRRNRLVPPRSGGVYAGLFSTAASSGIKDDPEAQLWLQRSPEVFRMSGFEGVVEGIAIKEIIHDNALSDTLGTNSDVGEGFVLGEDPVYLGFIEAPAFYTEWRDHQRFYSLAWHGDYGAGLPNTSASAGFPRGLHYTSA